MGKIKGWDEATRHFEFSVGELVEKAWKSRSRYIFIDKNKGYYVMAEIGFSQMDYPRTIRKFKTKAEALKYARQYMKTHPIG